MRALVAATALTLLLASAAPAAAWDPFADDRRSRRAPLAPVRAPAPAPTVVRVPAGIYRVTNVYVGNVVTRSGPVTTYSTATTRQDPGTYARVLQTVGSGTSSRYDGTAFNGRAQLSDGRRIAGTYYENFVLSGGRFVPVSVVFFQDDRELAAQRRAVPTPAPPSAAPLPAGRPFPLGNWRPLPAAAEPPRARRAPIFSRSGPPTPPPPPPVYTAPTPAPAPVPTPTPRVPVVVPGVATSPLGDIKGTIVVIRGRPIDVWVRATVDGRTSAVASWRVLPGEQVALGASAGAGGEPFRARWDLVSRPGSSWPLQIEATVHAAGTAHTVRGEVRVIVRSPALVR